MSKHKSTNNTAKPNPDELPYFAKLLPWQNQAWQQFVTQAKTSHLPHGLIASGVKGIGKHEFVWRAVAYQLCKNPNDTGACGVCESCHWLTAGTHPDLMVLPNASLPTNHDDDGESIKIDEIRELQHFSQLQSQSVRVVVLDGADTLTVGAANALLKTLEEPRDGVFIWLISDQPTKILPTIKSRVQALPLSKIDSNLAMGYLQDRLKDLSLSGGEIRQLLTLADGAVLYACKLATSAWYPLRKAWLQTFIALQNHTRTPAQASHYWQANLNYADFVRLSRMMVNELYRVGLGLPSLHGDMNIRDLMSKMALSDAQLFAINQCLDDNEQAISQNVQEKLAYERLIFALAA